MGGFHPGALHPGIWRYAAIAALLTISGTALFGAVHALTIVPIWRSLAGGLPFAFVAASVITWGYVELRRAGRLRPGLLSGVLYGCLLWLSILPTTLAGALFRVTGLHQPEESYELVTELILAALTGASAGLIGGSKRLALCLAIVVVSLVVAMAGPIPITNGREPLLLLLGFIPIYVVAGVVLAASHGFLRPGMNRLRA